jgi:hypothetical protein
MPEPVNVDHDESLEKEAEVSKATYRRNQDFVVKALKISGNFSLNLFF